MSFCVVISNKLSKKIWFGATSYILRHWRYIEPWPKFKVARNDKYAILWFKIKFFPASFNEWIFNRKISFLSDSPILPTRFGLKNRRGAFSSFLITCHWWHYNFKGFERCDGHLFRLNSLGTTKCCILKSRILKWGACSRWSFRPNSAQGSIETTIGKTHPTL